MAFICLCLDGDKHVFRIEDNSYRTPNNHCVLRYKWIMPKCFVVLLFCIDFCSLFDFFSIEKIDKIVSKLTQMVKTE